MARRPLWIWPNLLSLDAPLVALVWFWIFKQVWLVKYHQPSLPWFLALTVWCIYVADRLVDSRGGGVRQEPSTLRHRFHHEYRKVLGIALIPGFLGVFFLLSRQPVELISYAYPVAAPVLLYFLVSYQRKGRGIFWFKNIVAGLAFAYGTTAGVHFHRGSAFGFPELAISPEVVVFGALCMINMIAIDHWESTSMGESDAEEKERREFEKGILLILLLLVVSVCYLLALRAEDYTLPTHKAFYLSAMVGAGGLAFLTLFRALFSASSLRILADLALLLPAPFFYLFAR